MNELTPVRNISTITAEIRTIQQNVQMYASAAAMQIGERLTEAKELMPYGEWGKWLDTEFGWTERKAQQLMQVYREFGGTQKSLFGAEISNAKTFSDLSFSKLLLLVSVPESEREAFVEENNVGEISVREMKKLIAERDEARRARQDAESKLVLTERIAADREAMGKELKKKLEEVKKALSESEDDVDKQSGELSTLRRENKELRERPVETVTVVQKDEKAIADAVSAAKKEAAAEIEKIKKKLKTAVVKAEAAEERLKKADEESRKAAETASAEARRETEELRARLTETEGRLKTADPDTAIFKSCLETAIGLLNRMKEIQRRIAEKDAEKGKKLQNALNALCEQLKE